MPAPDPFAYPIVPHTPSHGPAGYADAASYKPWLRDDFAFRCAYCLMRERWDPSPSGHAGFGVDHVQARAVAGELVADYANLVYACNMCNSMKGTAPLPLQPRSAAFGLHVRVGPDGAIEALTEPGQAFLELFGLDSPGRDSLRFDKLVILRSKQTHPDDADIDHIFRRAFGYPDDLPDLSVLRPPGGNAVAGSEERSHFARWSRGELEAVY